MIVPCWGVVLMWQRFMADDRPGIVRIWISYKQFTIFERNKRTLPENCRHLPA